MRILLIMLTVTLLAAAPLHAQEATFHSEPGFMLAPSASGSNPLQVTASLSRVGNTEFTNGLGRVQVTRAQLGVDYKIWNLSYAVSRFDWERIGVIPFSSSDARAPWTSLHDLALKGQLLNETVNDKWRYWINGELSSSFENMFPGAVGAGFDGGVTYDFWDGWMIGATARTVVLSALNQDLLGDVEVGLALAVSPKTLRRLFRKMGLLPFEDMGPESIRFSVALAGADKTYRLDADSPVYRKGYLGLRQSRIGGYLEYNPNSRVSVLLGPEYYYVREYRLYNSAGALRSTHELDKSLGGVFRFQCRF